MANVTQIVTVKDLATHAAIAGAQVFVDGVNAGTTDALGNVTLSIAAGSFDLGVKKSGYITSTIVGAIAPQSNLIVDLESTVVATTATFRLIISPEDKADGMPLVFSNAGNPLNANYQIGGIEAGGLTVGPQTITGQVTGFQPINVVFDISQALDGVIQMAVSSDDSGGALLNRQSTAVTQDPDLLPTIPEVVQEYVAPNTNTGTYFTMTQARMYIGDVFIDELNSCQFALQDNKIPIYGYASRYWDAKAQGKSLVQGQLTINFISEGYLVKTLENYQNKIQQGEPPIDPVKTEQQARLLNLVNKLQNPDPNWTKQQFSDATTAVRELAAKLGPSAVNAASAQIRVDRQNQLNSILGLPGDDYANALYSDVEFDIVLQYTGAGRTITRRLEKCTLISNESIMDHSGTAILDSYGFIARRLR